MQPKIALIGRLHENQGHPEAPPFRRSDEARNQVAATRRAMAVPCDRNTTIGHRRVALFDEVRRHVGMLRARHAIAFACDIATVEAHCAGSRFNLAAVIGGVTDADEIHHWRSRLRVHVFGMMSDEFFANKFETEIPFFKRSIDQYRATNTYFVAID